MKIGVGSTFSGALAIMLVVIVAKISADVHAELVKWTDVAKREC